jgi:hypothetical protein
VRLPQRACAPSSWQFAVIDQLLSSQLPDPLNTLQIHLHHRPRGEQMLPVTGRVPDSAGTVFGLSGRVATADSEAQARHLGLWSSVRAEIRWAFTSPRLWLSGVAVNLVLALAWLLISPLHRHGHHDWVVLIGTYFSSFILADLATTNMLGVDHVRVKDRLREGIPLWRLLVVKDLVLLLVVGLPTLTFAMGLTMWLERAGRLAVTIPDVAVPIVSWLGFGNLVSVLLPVAHEPLIRRWHERRQLRRTSKWLVHLALPYVVFYVADPIYGLPHQLLWRQVPAALGPVLGHGSRGFIHIGFALIVWIICTAAAQVVVAVRGLHIE